MARPEYRTSCKYNCGERSFSHDSQEDADRRIRNHEQRCLKNPDNDPDAIRFT